MITAVIIDDERNNLLNLQRLLEQYCPNVDLKGTALDADAGGAMIASVQPDLVFLDIQMPGKNGFELLEELTDRRFELIMVTAYDQYGIQAVKSAAIDYLLKPVDIDELRVAVGRAVEKIAVRKEQAHLAYVKTLLQGGMVKEAPRISLSDQKSTRLVFIRDIVRCESSNSYTHFFLVGGEKITVSVALGEYELQLSPHGFVRCHQSHLVNKLFVHRIQKEDGGGLVMEDGSVVPVSRVRKAGIRNELL
jgi:two-component system LytT family response regulator